MRDKYRLKTWEEMILTRVPVVSYYGQVRGWPYVLSRLHRLTGLGLVLFVWFHLYTLQDLLSPSVYDAQMRFYSLPLLRFGEWLLSLPVLFHAFNGGRLILYESFRFRQDEILSRRMIGLVILVSGLLAVLMIAGNQTVSAPFFWMMALSGALVLVYGVAVRIWPTENTVAWKGQRLSGVFLLVMIPAHLFFMHLNPESAKEASLIILRLGHPLIKLVDALLVMVLFYHAGFGLLSITKDYIAGKGLQQLATVLIMALMAFSAFIGIRLLFII